MLADFEPKGAVAKRYSAYRDREGVCERALCVLDRRSRGAITDWLRSIPAKMGFSTLSNNFPSKQAHMAINRSDHIRGPAPAGISHLEYGDYWRFGLCRRRPTGIAFRRNRCDLSSAIFR
ncbi:hypothetical protein QA635_07855 [Bradyrhizobium brasilense]|nr:hypothetical protein [Bradyrhizobium australafricanum]WFU36818.1 hypothetical protein QA635_07855 [Bradyrhizobium australafricanum]